MRAPVGGLITSYASAAVELSRLVIAALSSLSAHEISVLTQQLKEEEANKRVSRLLQPLLINDDD